MSLSSPKLLRLLERLRADALRPLSWVALIGAVALGLSVTDGGRRTSLDGGPAVPDVSGKPALAAPATKLFLWRDGAGAVYRGSVDRAKLETLLRERKRLLDLARRGSREFAVAALRAGTRPVFAGIAERIPAYADWYYSYFTRYLMMGHALVPALDYLARSLAGAPAPGGLIGYVQSRLVAYLTEQYAARVLQPDGTTGQLESAYDNALAELRIEWTRQKVEYDSAIESFIGAQIRNPERIAPEAAKGLRLDWDGARDGIGSPDKDVYMLMTFRRGLLAPMVVAPRAAGAHEPMPPRPDEDGAENSDEAVHVIVELFGKVVDPVVSEMGNLVTGATVGGLAGGFAGRAAGGIAASGALVTVPVGAAVGLATTVASDVLSKRLEESLTRRDFERNLRRTVLSTREEVEAAMVTVLYRHIDAWYQEIVASPPVPGKS